MFRDRFRNFLPVIVDVETGGFDETSDALLEIAAITVEISDAGKLSTDKLFHYQVEPFTGATLNEESLKITGINPFDPARNAIPEEQALSDLFAEINQCVKKHHCSRAILVGHNAFFDLKFLNAAATRCHLKDNPFHSFSSIDTVSLGVLAYGQTVLSKIAEAADLPWDQSSAHSAKYDAEMTAKIFCKIFNLWENHAIELPEKLD